MNNRRRRRDKQHFFDKRENVSRTLWVLYAACAVLFLIDFVFHRHVLDPWEGLPAFYAVYGFVACVTLVLLAKQMRKLLMRKEDYYDMDE
ncbi:MAG: hypothetical protein ACE5LB_17165 [Acidiferrobacterales bacterium]